MKDNEASLTIIFKEDDTYTMELSLVNQDDDDIALNVNIKAVLLANHIREFYG